MVRSEQPTTITHRRPRRSPCSSPVQPYCSRRDRARRSTPPAYGRPSSRQRRADHRSHGHPHNYRRRSRTSVATPPKVVPAASGPSDLNTPGYRLMLAGNYAAALPFLRQAVAGLLDPANPVTAYANFNLGQDSRQARPMRRSHPLPATSPTTRARPPRSPRRDRLRKTLRQPTSPANEQRATLPRPPRSRQWTRQSERLRQSLPVSRTSLIWLNEAAFLATLDPSSQRGGRRNAATLGQCGVNDSR